MVPERAVTLIYELFSGLPRQGAGAEGSTQWAIELVPDNGSRTCVLDFGCGTGAQTVVLARISPPRVIAVDSHPPFIDPLNRKAYEPGLADRVKAHAADLRNSCSPTVP